MRWMSKRTEALQLVIDRFFHAVVSPLKPKCVLSNTSRIQNLLSESLSPVQGCVKQKLVMTDENKQR